MRRKKQGSTLVECTVALAIIAIAIAFLLTGYVMSTKMAIHSDDYKDKSNEAYSDLKSTDVNVVNEVDCSMSFELGTKTFSVDGQYRSVSVDNVIIKEYVVKENDDS